MCCLKNIEDTKPDQKYTYLTNLNVTKKSIKLIDLR